jgi:glutamyl-tRNA reductase
MYIAHFPKKEYSIEIPTNCWTFETCLRKIIFFSNEEDFSKISTEISKAYSFAEAYRFCLEVICGLHSRIFAETEVLGQFKNFIQDLEKQKNQNNKISLILPTLKNMVIDAKFIRTEYLKGLGQQSYGSIVRKWAKTYTEVAVLGSGHLTQKLYPWISEKIHIFTRSPKNYQTTFPANRLYSLNDLPDIILSKKISLIVIAAPIDNSALENLVEKFPQIHFFDLRGTPSPLQPFHKTKDTIKRNLEDLFLELATQSEVQEKIKNKVQVEIEKISQKRFLSQQVRPFGWDDLM